MKNLLLIFVAALTISACVPGLDFGDCNSDDPTLKVGWYQADCEGEKCIEMYEVKVGEVLEDVLDVYPNELDFYQGKFSVLVENAFEPMHDLLHEFPDQLWGELNRTIGSPDSGTLGGIYLEYLGANGHEFWLIDANLDNIPEYLHDYISYLKGQLENISQ